MNLEQSFTVAAPVEQVWEALVDVERVAPCLPGAEITGREDDGSYSGNFTVKLGPTTAAYAGTLKLDSVDEAARTTTMTAKGTDRRGQGGANATIVSTMTEQGAGTRVDVQADFTITGRLARFGRSGMIEDISQRLLREFADCLQSRLGGAPAEAAGPAVVPAPAAAGDVPAEAAGGEPASGDPTRVGTIGVPPPAEPGRQPVGTTGGAAPDEPIEPPGPAEEPLSATPEPPPEAASPAPPPPTGDAEGRVGTAGGGGAPPSPVTGPPPPPGGRPRGSEPEPEPEPIPEPEREPSAEPEPIPEPERPPDDDYLMQAAPEEPEEPEERTESIPPPGRETPPEEPARAKGSGGPFAALKRLLSRRK